MARDAHAPVGEDDPTFVPVEDRVLGLDRRTFGLCGAVIVLLLVAAVVLPAIDALVGRSDITTEGEVLSLAGTNALTLRAPGGWELTGIRLTDGLPAEVPSVTRLTKDGVKVDIRVAPFTGNAAELMDRVQDLADRQDDPVGIGAITQRLEATVGDATPAVVKVYTGLDRKGVVVTFVETLPSSQKVGVEVTITGGADAVTAQLASVLAAIDTITTGPARMAKTAS